MPFIPPPLRPFAHTILFPGFDAAAVTGSGSAPWITLAQKIPLGPRQCECHCCPE